MAGGWFYVFYDLLTKVPLVTLELPAPTFESLIVTPGAFNVTISMTNPQMAERVRLAFPPETVWPPPAGPGRLLCGVFTDAELTNLWDVYVIWEAPAEEDDKGSAISLNVVGASLESYAYHRQIWDDLAFADEDLADILGALYADMQADPPGDISVAINTTPTGVLATRHYKGSEAAKYGDRCEELANVETGGFEYRINNSVDLDGALVHELVTGTPNLDPGPAADIVAHQPGNVVSWRYLASALDTATRTRGRGDTANDDVTADSEPVMGAVQLDQALIDAGWPYLDMTLDRQGVTDPARLDEYARWWISTRSGVIRVLEVTIVVDGRAGPLHPSRLGAEVDVLLINDRYPITAGGPAFRRRWRLVGIGMAPASGQQGHDIARLIIEEGVRP